MMMMKLKGLTLLLKQSKQSNSYLYIEAKKFDKLFNAHDAYYVLPNRCIAYKWAN